MKIIVGAAPGKAKCGDGAAIQPKRHLYFLQGVRGFLVGFSQPFEYNIQTVSDRD
jgi:hypothetical protein